ncbi:MAG: penicillin-binding transpeptidase domain-containing protein [Lachnospiraceae bacterium]|nr:penicillin-binding transpeptidase domain-containing protein [Lachnospiraceae bacterium]
MREYIREALKNIFQSRFFVLMVVFVLMLVLLIQRVFTLQIVNGEEYLDTFQLKIEKERTLSGTRGNIYDRNGVPLAYNKLSYSVTISDNGSYETTKEKNQTLNETIYRLIQIIEAYGGEIDNDFDIFLNSSGYYEFSVSDTRLMRFKADVYGRKSADDLKPLEGTATAEDIIDYLCGDSNKYGLYDTSLYQKDPQKAKEECPYTDEEKLKIITVRYAMDQNRYQRYQPTTVATDVSDETVAAILENMDQLQGIEISEGTTRVYADSKYFSNILGYTGKASQEEIDELQKENEEYTTSDIIGKSGIEQYMETTLRGKNGSETLFVNNTGKVIEVADRTEPTAGNDVYLSIDAEYQKAAYDILEQKIAGILYSKIENIREYTPSENSTASDIKIPIDDVYYALIDNNVIDISHFSEEDATELEKNVYAKYLSRQESVLSSIASMLNNPDAPAYKDSTGEMKEYMSYIVNTFLTKNTGILDSSKVDTSDQTYKDWTTDEVINLYTYLNYAISMGWLDVASLRSDEKYLDSMESYQALVDEITEGLKTDNEFGKLIYKYMIGNDSLSGKEICLLLFDQKVLSYDDQSITGLENGTIAPYYFIKDKIRNLEITPAQLALDPCSGSVVMIDPRDGSLLALVSYPGYDNNRLANTMDSRYYAQLNKDKSSPFYNHATQERTAPGSTFKMVSSVTGLEEGVITIGEQITDMGIFDKITPSSPRCWIYTSSHMTHGSINVIQALEHSCNYFFYEVGYRLGQTDPVSGNYNSDLALSRLSKYAEMFGFEDKTGIEIPESEPQFSDQDAVRSAIGQGSHAYTTIQLGRYVASIANRGTVYNMTLLYKVTDSAGNLIEDYSPSIYNQIDISSSTWSAVQQGMRSVVENTASFDGMEIAVAGKTGTAQQSTSRPNHALFVGYAPYESPSLALACRIPFGYTSSNAAEVCRDIIKYCFNLADKEEILNGTASEAGSVIGD